MSLHHKILAPFALALVLFLGACAVFKADTPAQRVFAIQADYNAVLAASVAYESQPRCPVGVGSDEQACSEISVVQAMRLADDNAYIALRAAQEVVRTPGATDSTLSLAVTSATKAVSAFRDTLVLNGVI